jgi:hypothetical protein
MSRDRVNPLNPCEPLIEKVHASKPQHNAGVITNNEPYEPFLWLVWGNSDRTTTRRVRGEQEICNTHTGSCANRVHKVHASRLNRRLLAVLFVYLVSVWYTRVQRVHSAGDNE